MDTGTIIITVVFIAFVLLPFVLTGLSKNRKKSKMLQKLSELAAESNSMVSEYEFCSDFVQGLDTQSNHVFFYKKNDNREVLQHLNLSGFRSCKAITYGHTTGEKKNQYHVTDRLELCFYPYLKEEEEVSLDIYNSEFDRLTLTGELQFVEKWEKLMNERIKLIQKSKPEAGVFSKMTAAQGRNTPVGKPKKVHQVH